MFATIKKQIKAYFLAGLAVILPAAVTIKVLLWMLTKLDNVLKPLLVDVFGEYFFGIGIAIIILLVMAVGVLAKNYVGKRLVRLVERCFDTLPFVRTVYSVVRQLIEPFSSEQGHSFRQVVLIEYPMKGRFAIGFVAHEHVGTLDGEELITVFIPSNHLHLGYLVVTSAKDIVHLDISIEEALKVIVSCGIVVPNPMDIREMKQIPRAALEHAPSQ